MVRKPWHYPWSSTRAHMGTKYKVIELADIEKFLKVSCWKQYLMTKEYENDLKLLRESTMQGKVFGPVEMVKKLQAHTKQKLLPQARGRPRIN